MTSLKESLRKVTFTPGVVSLSPANPFGINLDFDIEKWAEGYIKELEAWIRNHPHWDRIGMVPTEYLLKFLKGD